MAGTAFVLSFVAALFFLLIILEELPVRFNVERVLRTVRRRARARQEEPAATLVRMRRDTARGVLVLVVFSGASALVLLWQILRVPAGSLARQSPILAFSGTLVVGLLELAGAFWSLAPALMDRVQERLAQESAGSNDGGRFEREKA